jgi:hypothetical protein
MHPTYTYLNSRGSDIEYLIPANSSRHSLVLRASVSDQPKDHLGWSSQAIFPTWLEVRVLKD